MKSGAWAIVDYSRYRVAEAIVEQFRAGDDPAAIGLDYELAETPAGARWIVELIVAAYDRRGMHRPARGWK